MNLINRGMHISFNFLDVDPKYSYILQKCADCPCLIFLTAQWTVFNVAIRWADKLMTTLLELSLAANWVGIWDHCVPSRIKRKYFSLEKVTCERKVLTSFWGLRGEKHQRDEGWQQLWEAQAAQEQPGVLLKYLKELYRDCFVKLLSVDRCCTKGSHSSPQGRCLRFSGSWKYFVFDFRAPAQTQKAKWRLNASLSLIQGKHSKCCSYAVLMYSVEEIWIAYRVRVTADFQTRHWLVNFRGSQNLACELCVLGRVV